MAKPALRDRSSTEVARLGLFPANSRCLNRRNLGVHGRSSTATTPGALTATIAQLSHKVDEPDGRVLRMVSSGTFDDYNFTVQDLTLLLAGKSA